MASQQVQLQTRMWRDVKDLYNLLPPHSAANRLDSEQQPGQGNFTAVGCVRTMQESASLEYSGMALVRLQGQQRTAHVRGRARPLSLTYQAETSYERQPVASGSGSQTDGDRIEICGTFESDENLNGTQMAQSSRSLISMHKPEPPMQGNEGAKQMHGIHRSTPLPKLTATFNKLAVDKHNSLPTLMLDNNDQPTRPSACCSLIPSRRDRRNSGVFTFEPEDDSVFERSVDEISLQSPPLASSTPAIPRPLSSSALGRRPSSTHTAVPLSPLVPARRPSSTHTAVPVSPLTPARRPSSTHTAVPLSPLVSARRPSSTHTAVPLSPLVSARRPSSTHTAVPLSPLVPARRPSSTHTAVPMSPLTPDASSPMEFNFDKPTVKRSRSFATNTDLDQHPKNTQRRTKSAGGEKRRHRQIRAHQVRPCLERAAGLQQVTVGSAQTEYLSCLVEWHVHELLVAVAALAQRQQHQSVRKDDLRELLADPTNQQLKDIFNKQ